MSIADLLKDMFQEDGSPVFFVRRGDRLIARLKHVLYGWRFAKQVGGRVVVLWPPPGTWSRYDGHDYSPSLIFDTAQLARDPDTRDLRFLDTAENFPPGGRSLQHAEFAPLRNNRFRRDFFEQRGLAFYEGNLMQYSFADEKLGRPALNAQLSRLFALLPLHPEVASVLAKIQADLDGKDFVCVHARGGDVFGMMREELPGLVDGSISDAGLTRIIGHYVVRTAPLDLYIPWVEKAVAEGLKVVFSSDSPEQIDWFKERFGADHFIDLANYGAKFPIQKALIDFMILMRGRRLIGTRSNYSSLASDLAGIPLVTVSAASTSGLTESDATQLYFDRAVSAFLPNVQLDASSSQRLRGEIDRRYKYVNRLGTKEEIALLDPRRRS